MQALLSTPRVFVAVIFLGLVAMAARNVVDPDVWWHLKTGELIVVHRAVPHTDPFSYTRAGAPWVAHEWLTDVALYRIYRTASWSGLILVFAAIASATFFLMFLRCGDSPYVAGIVTLVGAWATAPVWGVRPQVLSLFLASFWLLLLERSELNQRLIWWTLPIMLLWVNLHAGFALGIALLVLFLAGEFVERGFGKPVARSSNLRLRSLAATLLLNLLVIPFNPYGARMYSYPLETLRSKAMQNYIVEWASPNFHRADYFPFLILLLATLAVLAWSRARLRARDMLLLLVGAFAALSAIRMIPLFVLIAVPIISQSLQKKAAPVPLPSPGRTLPGARLLNAGILLFMAVFVAIHLAHVVRLRPQSEAEHFPTSAAAFLETHPVTGPIFNHYDWGGYLIWKLHPQACVFIDGRADLYGDHLLEQFADTYQLKNDWQNTLSHWRISTVIVPADSALAVGLRGAPGWSLAYEDPTAVIYSLRPSGQYAMSSCPQMQAPLSVAPKTK